MKLAKPYLNGKKTAAKFNGEDIWKKETKTLEMNISLTFNVPASQTLNGIKSLYSNNSINGEKIIIPANSLNLAQFGSEIRNDYRNIRFTDTNNNNLNFFLINNQGLNNFIVEIPHNLIDTTVNIKLAIDSITTVHNGTKTIFKYYHDFRDGLPTDIIGTGRTTPTVNNERVIQISSGIPNVVRFDIGSFDYCETLFLWNRNTAYGSSGIVGWTTSLASVNHGNTQTYNSPMLHVRNWTDGSNDYYIRRTNQAWNLNQDRITPLPQKFIMTSFKSATNSTNQIVHPNLTDNPTEKYNLTSIRNGTCFSAAVHYGNCQIAMICNLINPFQTLGGSITIN